MIWMIKAINQKQIKAMRKQIYILGDSIIKHVNGYEIANSVDNCKVYVKGFPGAKIRCMQDYTWPASRDKPDHIIIHVGTNDLASSKKSNEIAESIIALAKNLKTDTCDVSISNITTRDDWYRKKAAEVNKSLKELCKQYNFSLIIYQTSQWLKAASK